MTGVDITEPFLDAARESAAALGVELELVLADARAWTRPGAFGLALNLYTSFGYFDTRAEDGAMLAAARASLAPGGALIIELNGKELAVRDFVPGESFERDGLSVRTEFTVVGAWEGLRARWIVDDGKHAVDRSWVQRLYSATELRDSLLSAGFAEVGLYGSWALAPYDQGAETLIAVARAP